MPDHIGPHDQMVDDKNIIVYVSKGKVVLWLMLALGLIALGFQVVSNPNNQTQHVQYVLIGFVEITVTALAVVLGVLKLVTNKFVIMINREGISLNTAFMSSGLIKWAEIERLSVYRIPGQTLLRIVLRHPETIIARQNTLKLTLYWIMKGDLRRSRALSVGDALLPLTAHALLDQIEQRYRQELKRHTIDVLN